MSGQFGVAGVKARQVLDSRASPTVEAEVRLACGVVGRAAVPSGASTGAHEARELRDTGNILWAGRGVARAVENVNTDFADAVAGLDARDQVAIDRALAGTDPTPGFARLGANAALAVSMAVARAAAQAMGQPFYRYISGLCDQAPLLPLPMVNMISGGAHAGGNLDIQDVLVMPVGAASFAAGLEMVVRVYWALRGLLVEMGHPPLVGDEGGFGPSLGTNEEALSLVARAVELAGLRPGADMAPAIDVAATGLYGEGAYRLDHTAPHRVDAAGMIALMEQWANRYLLFSIEDALSEDDWEGWRLLTARLGSRIQLIGDDLFTTNSARLQRGAAGGCANAILVKVNQIGTLSEALATLRLARQHGYRAVISARSGETEDDWLADLAVGSGAGQIKVGSVARSERLAKYNRLLRIEEELGPTAAYAGGGAWRPMGWFV